jgi:hypothetical protein
MSLVEIAGFSCIAAAVFMTAVMSPRPQEHALPCVYCGKLLAPPMYTCEHFLGDGRDADSTRIR